MQKQVGDSSQEQMSKRGVHEANCGMRTAPFFEGRESHHVASVLGHRRKSSRKLHEKTADSSHRGTKPETPVKGYTSPQFLLTVTERREISVHVCDWKIWTATKWGDRLGRGAVLATGTLEVLPGHLIVDNAAGQAMIWGNSLRQMGTEVEERLSPRRTGSHQDGNSEGSGRRSTSHEINDDALSDRRSPGVLQYTVVEEDIPGLLSLSF